MISMFLVNTPPPPPPYFFSLNSLISLLQKPRAIGLFPGAGTKCFLAEMQGPGSLGQVHVYQKHNANMQEVGRKWGNLRKKGGSNRPFQSFYV
jgi:hypothetical protein